MTESRPSGCRMWGLRQNLKQIFQKFIKRTRSNERPSESGDLHPYIRASSSSGTWGASKSSGRQVNEYEATSRPLEQTDPSMPGRNTTISSLATFEGASTIEMSDLNSDGEYQVPSHRSSALLPEPPHRDNITGFPRATSTICDCGFGYAHGETNCRESFRCYMDAFV
ncbi:hypothetical protein EYR41_006116 [Orbilia oligospora]|uniref:Uncharacterized protein n=1 Tax=Orbilia oligospora TaxID=2813651 RepID=A0A8H2E449_ORBOL|nr:hypothetical protein EYR41_006116 [Orbilia oligospora]